MGPVALALVRLDPRTRVRRLPILHAVVNDLRRHPGRVAWKRRPAVHTFLS
jgi:hypothetical protein